MKKLFKLTAVLFACAFVFTGTANASFTDDFKNRIGSASSDNIKAFAADIGTLVGMNDFKSGQDTSLVGISLSANAVKTGSDNKLAKDTYMFTPFLAADLKIPLLGLSLAARGTAYDDFTSVGGGLRYGIAGDSILPFFPDITAGFFYDRINTDYYSADHFSASIAASIQVLFLEPYVGVGYDNTDLEVKSTGSAYDGDSFSSDGTRGTVGLNLHPFPFMQIYGAYNFSSDNKSGRIGVGAAF